MNTWTPLWGKVVDSSLWQEPYFVRVLFMTMMALKDKDDIVRYDSFGLARRGNMTEQEVLDGLKVLLSPDKRKLTKQPFDGRRVQEVEGGWLILNGAKYRALIKREYNARKQAEWREKQKLKRGRDLPGAATNEALEKNGATEAELGRHSDSMLPDGQEEGFPSI